MKNLYTIVILVILLSSCSMQRRLSSQLYQVQKQECGDYEHLKTLKENRDNADIFNTIDMKNDTLYIIESYNNDLERATITTSITYWSKRNNISSYMKKNSNKLVKVEEGLNKYIVHLINSWDIERIKSESERYAIMHPFKVYATRIFFINSVPQIEAICFDYFVNMKAEDEFYK